MIARLGSATTVEVNSDIKKPQCITEVFLYVVIRLQLYHCF